MPSRTWWKQARQESAARLLRMHSPGAALGARPSCRGLGVTQQFLRRVGVWSAGGAHQGVDRHGVTVDVERYCQRRGGGL